MNERNEDFREKLINLDMPATVKEHLLSVSLRSSFEKLSLYKRIENAILAIMGAAFFIGFLCLTFQSYSGFVGLLIRLNLTLGLIFSALWLFITSWQALRGKRNDRLYSPLKVTGIIGTLFMYSSMAWWYFFVPRILERAKESGFDQVGIMFSFLLVTVFVLLCIAAVLIVYWKLCREAASMREQIIATEYLILDLSERLLSK